MIAAQLKKTTLTMAASVIVQSTLAFASAESTFNIRSLITPNEFNSAGLNKLSPEELKTLNRLLHRFYVRVYEHFHPKTDCSRVIESQIDGTFEGWDGDTVFKLTNGQIWQQSSYDYTYEYDYMPDVLIFSSGGQCKLKVEGVNDIIAVRRLK